MAYVAAMTLMNLSAFGIYRLFGHFGPFHVAAIVSLATMLAGMFPLWAGRARKAWETHMGFMYWSVAGLYAAFFAELAVRSPIRGAFIWMVLSATAVVMVIAGVFQRRVFKRWRREVERPSGSPGAKFPSGSK